MAHSHQRTLLARMGFGDPDLKLPKHDVAVQYISEPQILSRLFEKLIAPSITSHRILDITGHVTGVKAVTDVKSEIMLTKGAGAYASTVGFIDLTAVCHYGFKVDDERAGMFTESYGDSFVKRTANGSARLVVEVKITPETTAAILRQIGVYREFQPSEWRNGYEPAYWIVATDFPITQQDALQLIQSNVYHVKLGSDFESYYDAVIDPRNLHASSSIEI